METNNISSSIEEEKEFVKNEFLENFVRDELLNISVEFNVFIEDIMNTKYPFFYARAEGYKVDEEEHSISTSISIFELYNSYIEVLEDTEEANVVRGYYALNEEDFEEMINKIEELLVEQVLEDKKYSETDALKSYYDKEKAVYTIKAFIK